MRERNTLKLCIFVLNCLIRKILFDIIKMLLLKYNEKGFMVMTSFLLTYVIDWWKMKLHNCSAFKKHDLLDLKDLVTYVTTSISVIFQIIVS